MHGGKRTGAGRPKGERARAVLEAAEAGGEMPIAYMLNVMRNEKAPDVRRDRMAKAAAAYLYPKFGTVTEPGAEEPASPEQPAAPAEVTADV